MALCKIITNKLIPALLKVWKKSLYLILACSLMVHQYLYVVLRLGQASGVWGELLKEFLVPYTQSVSVSVCGRRSVFVRFLEEYITRNYKLGPNKGELKSPKFSLRSRIHIINDISCRVNTSNDGDDYV